MLKTLRLILRPATVEDASYILEVCSDPEVVRHTGDTVLTTLSDSEALIRDRLLPQFRKYKMGRFLIFLQDGSFVGWCGLRFIEENQTVDLGYRLKKNFWGMGFAQEAARACLEYGFEELGLTRIYAQAKPENIPSLKVLQKLGMTFKGLVRDPLDSCSLVLYEITLDKFRLCVN